MTVQDSVQVAEPAPNSVHVVNGDSSVQGSVQIANGNVNSVQVANRDAVQIVNGENSAHVVNGGADQSLKPPASKA